MKYGNGSSSNHKVPKEHGAGCNVVGGAYSNYDRGSGVKSGTHGGKLPKVTGHHRKTHSPGGVAGHHRNG